MARTLARSGTGPIYEQIRRAIAAPIVAGRWRPGRRIPSEMELTKAFKASRMTVNRALTALAAEGLIVRWRRRGSFVAERAVELVGVRDLGHRRGDRAQRPRLRLRAAGARAPWSPMPTWQPTWTWPLGTPLLALTCRHSADGEVVQLEHRLHQSRRRAAGRQRSFDAIAPGRWLLDHVPWSEAEHTIRAEAADARTARLMHVERGAACLVIERRTWQGRKAITLARLVHPGARHALTGRFRPGGVTVR